MSFRTNASKSHPYPTTALQQQPPGDTGQSSEELMHNSVMTAGARKPDFFDVNTSRHKKSGSKFTATLPTAVGAAYLDIKRWGPTATANMDCPIALDAGDEDEALFALPPGLHICVHEAGKDDFLGSYAVPPSETKLDKPHRVFLSQTLQTIACGEAQVWVGLRRGAEATLCTTVHTRFAMQSAGTAAWSCAENTPVQVELQIQNCTLRRLTVYASHNVVMAVVFVEAQIADLATLGAYYRTRVDKGGVTSAYGAALEDYCTWAAQERNLSRFRPLLRELRENKEEAVLHKHLDRFLDEIHGSDRGLYRSDTAKIIVPAINDMAKYTRNLSATVGPEDALLLHAITLAFLRRETGDLGKLAEKFSDLRTLAKWIRSSEVVLDVPNSLRELSSLTMAEPDSPLTERACSAVSRPKLQKTTFIHLMTHLDNYHKSQNL
jgi:hypothetical protein